MNPTRRDYETEIPAIGGIMPEYVCHLWLGRFGPDAPPTYFVQERVDDDTTPASQFGAEQGQPYFDCDFVEITFEEETRPVRDLVDRHSYSDSYLDSVVTLASDLGVTKANVFVLSNKDQFKSPRSASGPSYRLWYLGEFICKG